MECNLGVDDPASARVNMLLRWATWIGAALVAAGAAAAYWPAGVIVAGASLWKIAGASLVAREARAKAAQERWAKEEARRNAPRPATATTATKPGQRPAPAPGITSAVSEPALGVPTA